MVKCRIITCCKEAVWAVIPEDGSGIEECCEFHTKETVWIQLRNNVGCLIEGVPHAGEAD